MRYFATVAIFVLCIAGAANAQATKMSDLATSFSEAFGNKTMASMDTDKPYMGSMRFTLEHSISGKSTMRTFKSMAKADEWFTSREKEGLPSRNATTLKGCSKGLCTFDTDSILHNNLYVKSVAYARSKGKYYIKSVRILDGD